MRSSACSVSCVVCQPKNKPEQCACDRNSKQKEAQARPLFVIKEGLYEGTPREKSPGTPPFVIKEGLSGVEDSYRRLL